MKLIRDDFKRLFSTAAAEALNALARFANNMNYGFGIKLMRRGESVNIALNRDDADLQTYIAEVANNAGDTTTPAEASGPSNLTVTGDSYVNLITSNSWARGTSTTGVKLSVCTGGAYAGDSQHWVFKFRNLTFDKFGRLVSVSDEVGGYHVNVY